MGLKERDFIIDNAEDILNDMIESESKRQKLKEIETPNAMISYFAEQLGPLIEKSEIKQPTYLYWELMRKAGSGNL